MRSGPRFSKSNQYAITEDIVRGLEHPSHTVDVITWAFENIPSERPILQLLVNHFCHEWDDEGYDAEDANALELLPIEFRARVMRRFAESNGRILWSTPMLATSNMPQMTKRRHAKSLMCTTILHTITGICEIDSAHQRR